MNLALCSGLLLTLSFPNIFHKEMALSANLLAWVSLVPLLFSLQNTRPKEAFKRGYAAGLLFFFLSLYWIRHIKPMGPGVWPAWVALAAYLALYPGLFSFCVARGLKQGWSFEALWIPALWTLFEYARETLLTGYPWNSLGASQCLNAPLLPLVSVTGIYGLHYAVALGNVALWQALRGRAWPRRELAALGLSLALLLGLRLMARPRLDSADKVKVAVLQGNIDQDQDWTEAYRRDTMQVYGALMQEAVDAGAKVLVWPESGFPGIFNQQGPEAQDLIRYAKAHRVSLVLGSTLRDSGSGVYTNAAVFIDAAGNSRAYIKRHLVPFGEFIPLSRWIPFLENALRRMGVVNFGEGHEAAAFDFENFKAAPLICYESVYGSLARESSTGAIVLITLDTWFGDSAAPRHHLSQAVFRAVEGGRWVARSAATGISGFVSPQGRIVKTIALNTRGWSLQEIDSARMPTFYFRFGAWFVWVCAGFLAVAALFRRKVI
jgi:apolipoprotein N-acyltransferase